MNLNWFRLQNKKARHSEIEKADQLLAGVERAELEQIPVNIEDVSEQVLRCEDRISYYEKAEKELDNYEN